MSYPSGSTLLVTLQNGASPNTGPFDIYINDLSSSSNLIANDVSKATLSGSGYTFITPLETFRVWAKSDSTITNADVAILGEVPGLTKSFRITGSYESSINSAVLPSEVFCDSGYGMQTAGVIPTNLNTCPSTTGIGTSSISPNRNTLVTVKFNETGSSLVKFFPNGAANSVFFYHVPCVSSSGTNETSLNICVDTTVGFPVTAATNSINLYPSATQSLSMVRQANFLGSAPYGNDNTTLLVRVNGSLIYSGSSEVMSLPLNVPANALVEVTSSIMQTSLYSAGGPYVANFVTNSISVALTTPDGLYFADLVTSQFSTEILSGSTSRNDVSASFIALAGGQYAVSATQTGNLIYSYMFDGLGLGYDTRAEACATSTGGPSYYTFWSDISTNNTIFYNDIGMTTVFTGSGVTKWYASRRNGGNPRTPARINGSGLVVDFSGPC